jgi:hypothetical protein
MSKELNVARDLILVSQVLKRCNELNVIPKALAKFVRVPEYKRGFG